jgi:WD40 repeat protein
MLREQHTIYLFNTKTHAESVLRGHAGRVLRMAFAPAHPNKPLLLVSAAEERDRSGTIVGRVCLWDTSKASSLNDKGDLVDHDALVDELILKEQRPKQQLGLDARHTGPGMSQLHVAIAWSDGKLRVWDVDQKGPGRVREAPDGLGNWNNTAVYLSGPELLTGGRGERGGGYLQRWNDRPQGPEKGSSVPLLPPDGYQSVLLRSVCLVSREPGAGPSHAATAVDFHKQGAGEAEFGLVLMDLAKGSPVATAPLWRGTLNPVVASSPRGQYLAVAGDKDHSIWVYSVGELLRNQIRPQHLRSIGMTMRSVAFVQKNQDLGLLLSVTPKGPADNPVRPARDDLVFDFAKRSLTPDPPQQGWSVAGPDLDGWRVKRTGSRFDWQGPKMSGQVTLELPATERITDYVLLPPSPFSSIATLAVATWDQNLGQALIRLYHAKTGEWLRQFREHSLAILSLAASRDGRFLVSAAEDQTVCIWTLADLDKIVGKQGALTGVFVQKRDNKLVVHRVDPGSPAQGKLEKDDVVEALVTKAGSQPRVFVPSPFDYYNAMWDIKPGTKISLQIERQGAKRNVEVVVGQGVDDQRPLLSLFAPAPAPPPAGKTREWIAWNPIGPYDASSKDVERFLGWHFNPSKLEEPARFARADSYRDKFYKPLLLKPLLDVGDIHKTLREIDKPPPVPKPNLELQVDSPSVDLTQKDERGQILVRDVEVTLQVTITGPSFDKGQVEQVNWRLDNGPAEAFDLAKASGQRLSKKIRLPAERGVRTLQVQLQTQEEKPQTAVREVELRYQPPPPAITFDEAWLKEHFSKKDGASTSQLRQTVQDRRFSVRAQVRSALAGQEVRVSLRQNKGEPSPLGLRVDQTVDLEPGENLIVLQADNKDALPGFEQFERDQKTLVVDFHRRPGPELLIRTVEPFAAGRTSGPTYPVAVEPGKPVVVHYSTVLVRGTVKAPEKLKRVDVTDPKGKVVAQAEPATPEFTLDQKLSLEPGEQSFRFRAESANTEPTEQRLTLVYQPPLPELRVTAPIDHLELTKGRDEPETDIMGRFALPEEAAPFEVVIAVTKQGKTVPQAGGTNEIVVVFGANGADWKRLQDKEAQKLARVRLQPGSNRIRITVRNAGNPGSPQDRHVSFKWPPRILTLTNSPPNKRRFTDLVAKIDSPTEPTRVEINREQHRRVEKRRPAPDKEPTIWEIRAQDVSLIDGNNSLSFSVSNEDGPCLEKKSLNVECKAAQQEVPSIKIDKPHEAQLNPEYELQFRAASFTKLTDAELRQGSGLVQRIDVSDQKENDFGYFELKKSVRLHLKEGTNNFRIAVINEGGPNHDDVALSLVRPAVRLVMAGLPEKVAGPALTLNGHLAFRDAEEALRSEGKPLRIRVFVNGFLQRLPPIQGQRTLSPEVPFAAELLLNRNENLIQIDCPDLPLEAGLKQELKVKCDNPRPPATLHLLIVGIDVRDKAEQNRLVKQALGALDANGGEEGLRSAVFNRVVMHPYSEQRKVQIVADYVHQGDVTSALDQMRYFIEKKGSPSDVALIYWLGRDLVQENGEWYLPTSENLPGATMRDTGVALRQLLAMDEDVRGARVLLLDVSSLTRRGPSSPELSATHVAMLRYEWSIPKMPPVPGLLEALEKAAGAGKRISLQDMQVAADKNRTNYPDAPTFTHNLQASPLAPLILIQRP